MKIILVVLFVLFCSNVCLAEDKCRIPSAVQASLNLREAYEGKGLSCDVHHKHRGEVLPSDIIAARSVALEQSVEMVTHNSKYDYNDVLKLANIYAKWILKDLEK